MQLRRLRVSLLIPALAALLLPGALEARSLYGTFSEVKSAEHLVLQHDAGTYEVRLFGVDAPEGSEPFALQAKQMLQSLVQGKECRVRIMTRNDRGEMVSQVIANGEDVGLALIRAGLAKRRADVHYKPHAKGEPDALVAAENQARLAGLGIWTWPTGADKSAGIADAADSFVSLAERGGGTTDLNASIKSGDDNECAIAQNPNNAMQLFMSCNTSSAGLFAARSVDGGTTWTYPDATDKTIADGDAGQGTSACCDPTLAWDTLGNLYVTYINAGLNQIVTLLSTDGGATFSPLATFTGSIDQPTVVAANTTGGVAVWIVWNQSGSIVARGATATALGTVGAFSTLQTAPTTSGCNFGDIAIAPNGAVVQVCEVPSGGQGPATLRINIDSDGLGAGNFGTAINTITTNVGGFDFIPAQNSRSVDSEAGFAFDSFASSPHFGRLYMVYTEETVNENNDLNILVRFSADNGATWSAPIQVNDDATTRSQFLPKIASDPLTGNVAVCWHDSRNSGTNTSMEIFCSQAAPAATPVFGANVLISDGASTSNGNGVEFGDYMGLAFVDGVAHPVWADTSNSTANNPNGTSAFDAYSDVFADAGIFSDGFETGNTSAWSLTVP